MRIFLTVIVAGVLSAAAGVAVVFFATGAWPVGFEVYGFLFGTVFYYSPIAMIVFGLTLWWCQTKRALWIAMLLLAALPVLLMVFIMVRGGGGDALAHELRFVLIFSVSLILVAVVQWLVLRTTLRRAGVAS